MVTVALRTKTGTLLRITQRALTQTQTTGDAQKTSTILLADEIPTAECHTREMTATGKSISQAR